MRVKSDAKTVAAYANRVLPLETASLGDEYYYQSLPLCVIDAVFSIGIQYGVVRNVIARYCKYTKQRCHRDGDEFPTRRSQESISVFCDRPEQTDPAVMANRVYQDTHRTSSRNGILKSDAVIQFARCLRQFGVDFFQDLPKVADNAKSEAEIRAIRGQNSGVSLQYFWMLAGSDEFIKPDRWVLQFLQSALSRRIAVAEAQPLMTGACELLVAKFSQLTPRLLDHEVWKYQRATGTV